MNCVVVTPTYWVKIPILDDGSGPSEPAADVCLVLGAKTRKEAKWAAYRVWKQQGTDWVVDARSDGVHPLTGLTIEPWPDDAGDDIIDLKAWSPFVADLRAVPLSDADQETT